MDDATKAKIRAEIANLLAQQRWEAARTAIMAARTECDAIWEVELKFQQALASYHMGLYHECYMLAEAAAAHYSRVPQAMLSQEQLMQYLVARAMALVARTNHRYDDNLALCRLYGPMVSSDLTSMLKRGLLPEDTDTTEINEWLEKLRAV